MKDIDKLIKIYNSLEASVRNLSVAITSDGTLLISILFLIVFRIPSQMKFLMSRKFKNNVFDLDKLIEIFKEQLFARERVQATEGNKNSNSDETDYFTGHNLLSNSRKSDKKYEKKLFNFKSLCLLQRGKSHIDSL